MLASAGEDDDIILWELLTSQKRVGLRGHEGRVHSVAFAPDGRTLASGGGDGQVLAWDVWDHRRSGAPALTPGTLAALWVDLGSRDAGKAFRAMRQLASAPKDAVPFLRGRLRPASREVPPVLAQLLLDLNDNRFQVRERAEQELFRRGDESEVAVSRALAGNLPLEVRRRLERVGEKRRQEGLSAEGLRSCRAVEVLEYLGTAAAREALRQLAGGAPEARLSREAADALRRLTGRTRHVLGSE